MSFIEIWHPSPNFSTSPAHECLGVCFHHSAATFEQTIHHMLQAEHKVSYHVLIAPDGERGVLVDERFVAWHAGESSFRGRAHCNDFLLGLSFAGDTYEAPLTDAQIASALEWLEPRWIRYGWTMDMMVDHRQIAPDRKRDLKPSEWVRLVDILNKHFPPTA